MDAKVQSIQGRLIWQSAKFSIKSGIIKHSLEPNAVIDELRAAI